MDKRASAVLLVAALCLGLAACKHEPKPDKDGVFMVVAGNLLELPEVSIDQEFTEEGFAINFFSGDPKIGVRTGDFYFIFSGDYQPYGLRAFVRVGMRWEQDSGQTDLTSNLRVGGMEDEKKMHKGTLTKPLKAGTYIIDVQRQNGRIQAFAFVIE